MEDVLVQVHVHARTRVGRVVAGFSVRGHKLTLGDHSPHRCVVIGQGAGVQREGVLRPDGGLQ